MRDLPKLGGPAASGPGANVTNTVEVGGPGSVFDLGWRHAFQVKVSAGGTKGQVESTTDFAFHIDPERRYGYQLVGPATGPPAGTIVDVEGQKGGARFAAAAPVALYPVILKYERFIRLKDRDGRECKVTVTSTMQFTYEKWASATEGRAPSLETLETIQADTGFTNVLIEGGGPVQKYDAMAWNEARSISAGLAKAESDLEASKDLADAAGLSMTFIRPDETAGSQFETLEAVLARLDRKEQERLAKLPVVDFSGGGEGDLQTPSATYHVPVWAVGILKAVGKLIIGLAIALGVAAAIAASPLEIGFGAALLGIGVVVLSVMFLWSIYKRSVESVDAGGSNPLFIFGVALLDAIGVGALYEAITDRSLLTGLKLNQSEEDRWERGTSGLLNLLMTLVGVRSAVKGGPTPGSSTDVAPASSLRQPPATLPPIPAAFPRRSPPSNRARRPGRSLTEPRVRGRRRVRRRRWAATTSLARGNASVTRSCAMSRGFIA